MREETNKRIDMKAFFALLQMAVGTRDSFPEVPDSEQAWRGLLEVVAEHCLLGVTFPVIKKLHDQGIVPLEVLIPWGLVVDEIAKKNHLQREAVGVLYQQFMKDGFRNCLLKGQASGNYYPNPLQRQSGDIDLWMEGGHKKVMAYLRPRYKVRKTRYIHCDAQVLKHHRVEIHFTPSWMFAPGANRRLQRWFASQADVQFSHFDPILGCAIPTTTFNAVYMMLHIYRHLLEEGIGLRQLLDYYYVLQHLTPEDRIAVLRDLQHLGLDSFAGAVMHVLREVFGLGEAQMLCPPNARRGALLLEAILESGNFGMADPLFAGKARKEGIIAHGWRKFKRNLRFLQLCPSEVVWMPFFVTWQYFWRRKHGYLYKGR